jgi:Domain of unknown function (DUF4870)
MSQDFPDSTSAGQWPEGQGAQPYGQPPGQEYGQATGPAYSQPPGYPAPGAAFGGFQQAVRPVQVAGHQGYGPRGPSDDNMWALLSYISPIIVSFLGPLIIYLIKKDESQYVH